MSLPIVAAPKLVMAFGKAGNSGAAFGAPDSREAPVDVDEVCVTGFTPSTTDG